MPEKICWLKQESYAPSWPENAILMGVGETGLEPASNGAGSCSGPRISLYIMTAVIS